MNVAQIILVMAIFCLGLVTGWCLFKIVPELSGIVLSILFGCIFLFYSAWPIYKIMHWAPSLPTCPRPECHNDTYYILGFKDNIKIFRCTRCGQIIELKNETIAVREKDNSISTYLILRWPGILGRWKKVSIW
jgi:hypothetical protein